MPTILSRKYDNHMHFVTPETWELMKEKGLSRRFRVIDDSDIGDTIQIDPEKMVDFTDQSEVINSDVEKSVENIGEDLPEMTKDELKTELDKMGVVYTAKMNKKDLYSLYIDNQ